MVIVQPFGRHEVQRPPVPDSFPLLVTAVSLAADSVIAITLQSPDGAPLPEWTPGAHIDVCLPSGLIRQYSLCGRTNDKSTYRIAVLRESAGRGGSAEIHDLPLAGRTLYVRGPRNRFQLETSARYIFIAGGIGITPVIPMITKLGQDHPWTLFYGGRTRTSMAFADEVHAIGGDRVKFVPEDEAGLIDVNAIVASASDSTAIYCCGPPGLIRATEAACSEATVSIALHTERFTSTGQLPDSGAQSKPPESVDEQPFVVELRKSGITLVVPTGRTLLEVIREVMPDVPYSCEEGYCGSCEANVLEGEPDHRDDVLSPAERASGETIMPCVSRARSEVLALDL